MNREEVQREYLKLLDEKAKEEQEIIKNAKEQGIWKPGLDANRDLFVELNNKFQKQVEELKSKLEKAPE